MQVIKFILAAWSLCVIEVLIVFLGRIAYFYERTSGQRVGYRLLVIPASLLAAGAIWYLFHDVEFVGEPIGGLLLLVGGLVLFLLSARLQELMTGERR